MQKFLPANLPAACLSVPPRDRSFGSPGRGGSRASCSGRRRHGSASLPESSRAPCFESAPGCSQTSPGRDRPRSSSCQVSSGDVGERSGAAAQGWFRHQWPQLLFHAGTTPEHQTPRLFQGTAGSATSPRRLPPKASAASPQRPRSVPAATAQPKASWADTSTVSEQSSPENPPFWRPQRICSSLRPRCSFSPRE